MIDYAKLQKAIAGGIFAGLFIFSVFVVCILGLLGAMLDGGAK